MTTCLPTLAFFSFLQTNLLIFYLMVSLHLLCINGNLASCQRPFLISSLCHAAVLEEKAAALHALGAYAEHVPGSFAPHIESALKLVLHMCEYYHDTIREEAYSVLSDILQATEANFPPPGPGGYLFYCAVI